MAEPRTHASPPKPRTTKVIADNRRARHEYAISEELEVGIVLGGTEVKSIRAGKVQLSDGYAQIKDGELWLENVHIAPYVHGNRFNLEDKRARKLLAHAKEIAKLKAKLADRGATLIPLKMYFKGNKAKVLLGLARGKKLYDKREAIKSREARRDLRAVD